MNVPCPNCSDQVEVQLTEVRRADMRLRPVDCLSCGAEFDLWADGRTEVTLAHPKESTARGRELLKCAIVFDPKELVLGVE